TRPPGGRTPVTESMPSGVRYLVTPRRSDSAGGRTASGGMNTHLSPVANCVAPVAGARVAQVFQPLTTQTHMRSALGCGWTASTRQTSTMRVLTASSSFGREAMPGRWPGLREGTLYAKRGSFHSPTSCKVSGENARGTLPTHGRVPLIYHER